MRQKKSPYTEVNNWIDKRKKFSREKEKDHEVKKRKEKKSEVQNRANEAKKIPLYRSEE